MSPQQAFEEGDGEASRDAHEARSVPMEGGHSLEASRYVKQIVYGGLDGIISSFALVAAIAGARLPSEVLLLIGFANLVADAISMAIGSFLAATAERDHILRERSREKWEYENFPEGEIAEMVELYMRKGFLEEDARAVIAIYTSREDYKDAFIDHMMTEELGFVVPKDTGVGLLLDGLTTGLSFVAFGSLPLWVVAALYASGDVDFSAQVLSSAGAAVVGLFALGICKARLTREMSNQLVNAVVMTANGALAAGAAFLVGSAVHAMIGDRVQCTVEGF